MYAFPPFSIIGRFLQHVEEDEAEVCAVLPCWPSQPWFSRALRLLRDHPVLLPMTPSTIYLPQYPGKIHQIYTRLKLTLFPLSGNSCRQGLFTASYQNYHKCLEKIHSGSISNIHAKMGTVCVGRKIDPKQANEVEIIEFLTQLFHSGVGYSAVCSAKAAVVNFVSLMADRQIDGGSLIFNRFMRGFLPSDRTPVRDDLGCVTGTSLSQISVSTRCAGPIGIVREVAMLMVLLTGHRGQSIHMLDMGSIECTRNMLVIAFRQILKTSRPVNSVRKSVYQHMRKILACALYKRTKHMSNAHVGTKVKGKIVHYYTKNAWADFSGYLG